MKSEANPLAYVCPACGGVESDTLLTLVGPRACCLACFHGWRLDQPQFAYTNTAMCSLGTSVRRLRSQIDFFAPFVSPFARVLEIGCATGELAGAVRASLPIGSYEGIELSPAGDKARAHLDKLHVSPLPVLLQAGGIEGSFDLIVMSHVLEHLAAPEAELRAMMKVLRPGGTIFLEVPNRGGARSLPIDDNRAHLHFFCVTSLTRLLARVGLETVHAATDVRLDARYSDSLQVIAQRFHTPTWSHTLLSDHPLLAGVERVVVWGAGSLADELLANFFDPAKIDFFVDRDRRKIGVTLLDRPVRAPEALGSQPRTVLVNSIDFADAICADICGLYPEAGHRLIRIGDLIERPVGLPRQSA